MTKLESLREKDPELAQIIEDMVCALSCIQCADPNKVSADSALDQFKNWNKGA